MSASRPPPRTPASRDAEPRPATARTAAPRTAAPRSDALPMWGALCFFASGAAGLLYEIVWSKQLSYLLGNSLHAVATVVAAFLGGLALGALLLGIPLARRGHGARTYALLEIGVGVLGLVLLPLLRALDPLVGELYRALGGEGTSFAAARFALLFALLVPPAALMGATLPVLVAHFERDRVGPALARLYAINTLGAVTGSLLGGFALLPRLGLLGTSVVAAVLNVAVAWVAWRAAGASALPSVAGNAGATVTDPPSAAQARTQALPGGLTGRPRLAFALLFALSGFAALAFQIAWVRLFGLMFGSSVYSFSAVLGVYLLGLALGSAAIAGSMRRGISLSGFGRLQLALAAFAALALHGFSRLPDWTFQLAESSGPRWGALFTGEVLMVAAFVLVPCALLGAAFPIATRLLQEHDGGHATGFAYAVNTAGTIAGSLIAGFIAVPTWGVQGTHLAALLIALGIGLACLALARGQHTAPRSDLTFAAVACAVVALLAFTAPRWDPALMSAGPYRPVQASKLSRSAQLVGGGAGPVRNASRLERVLYYREGVNGSVLVGTDEAGTNRWLRVGGKIDASLDDMETQVLLGLLPAALADSGARTLVVGLGSGITAAAALAGGAGETDVVEIERGVVEASRFFHAAGEDPLDDPRVHMVVGDARTQLAHGSGRYGLIVSEPSNPWIAGVNNLFTVDFYRLVRARLEPDGVFCQWMQLYELSPATFASMIASFREVFPEGHVFVIWRAVDVLLVACPPERSLSRERLAAPRARRMLEQANIESPEAIAAYYAGELSDLDRVARGATLNRDDRPVVEYRAPRDMVEVGRSALQGHPQVVALVPFASAPPAGPLFADWSNEGWFAGRIGQLSEQGDEARAALAIQAARSAGFTALADGAGAELDAHRRRVQGQLQVDEAIQFLAVGRREEGRAALERAVVTDPANARTWVILADQRRIAGDLAGAQVALAHGTASPDSSIRAEAAVTAGILELTQQRAPAALAYFQRAQQLNPAFARAYVLEAKVRFDAGDAAGAQQAIRRGLEVLPGDEELRTSLARLTGGS